MQDFARQLMSLRQGQAQNNRTATAIFGSASQVSRSLETRERLRIAALPCISSTNPELAMGLMTALAAILDSWPDIRVYRLFAQLEGTPDTYRWSLERSQFAIGDWEIDSLDDNVGMWGNLTHADDTWLLTIEAEDDDQEDGIVSTHSAADLAGLVTGLPQIAREVAAYLRANHVVLEVFDTPQADDQAIRGLLESWFKWQVQLNLALWGQQTAAQQVHHSLPELLDRAQSLGEFGAWCISSALSHAMQPGYGAIAASLAARADETVTRFANDAIPAIYLGAALFRLGEVQQAYEMLEAATQAHGSYVGVWLMLADLYRRGGRVVEMIDTYQRAIEAQATSATLYSNYATVLDLIDDSVPMDTFVLIDPDEYYDNHLTWEAIEAFSEARKLQPDSLSLLQRQVSLLMDVADDAPERLHDAFKTLVMQDTAGEHVHMALESIDAVDDPAPLITILEDHAKAAPDRVEWQVNLAIAYLSAEEYELAAETLEAALELTEDEDRLAEIDRLLLSADDPDFEPRLAEIEAQVESGGTISGSDIAFLERTIDQAPSVIEAYLFLARTHINRGREAAALDLLMDGYEENPDAIEIITLIGQVLWASNQRATAFEYLNKGLQLSSGYVPLLATVGQYLFEDGQEDEARSFLARAEAISPRHPALAAARRAIADSLANRD